MFFRQAIFLFVFTGPFLHVFSQVKAGKEPADSSTILNDVAIRAYFHDQPILSSPSSAAVLSLKRLHSFTPASLVPAINTIPGVRMEERSPGSYRLSIRGSLLRSPFGVRNVKIYFDEFSLTDAGGNTYVNLADASSISRVEILKGPEGSIFGANTGGVVLLDQYTTAKNSTVEGGLSGGSYGLFHENAAVQTAGSRYRIGVKQAFERADGYRQNSALKRGYYSINQQFKYSPSSELRSMLLFSDLQYRTPGGLTLAQSDADPRAARPAAGKIPGAIQQQAGIYNKTIVGGLLNETALTKNIRFVTALSGIHTDFKNPFITNYEVREENSFNLRTFAGIAWKEGATEFNLATGMELQRTFSSDNNYGNRAGVQDTLQAADQLGAAQDFGFSHLELTIHKQVVLEAASSLDLYGYHYSSRFPKVISRQERRFDPRLMPRFAASWLITPSFAIRASASRGYSAPTIAEVRASDNVINTGLEPEQGWNYETGLRFKNNFIYLDASVFNFRLTNAIVRRLNASDAEYFINAGGTVQNGFESAVNAWIVQPQQHGLLQSVRVSNAVTLSRFSFSHYLNGTADFSGNRLTGVPRQSVISSITAGFPAGFSLFIQHAFTSEIPLNDANTSYAKPAHVFQARVDFLPAGSSRYRLQPYLGVDNLLNARYSLGNDLNAAGNRYFNPSPPRNYYAGITFAQR